MKRSSRALALVLLAGLALARCNGTVAPEQPVDPVDRTPPPEVNLTRAQQDLVAADNRFGLKLFQTISQAEGQANVFVSPLSVSMALGMALNGADGDTRAAMAETLELAGLPPDDVNAAYRVLIDLLTGLDERVRIEIANSIWYRDTFSVEQAFLDVNTQYFGAAVRALDFGNVEAAGTINAWVDENTHGKIDKIVEAPIDPLTMMFLINAVYFKGDWTYQFDEERTTDDAFTQADGTTADVKMMTMTGARFPYLRTDDFQAIDLPYGDSLFSMTVLLPRQGWPLDSLVARLDALEWGRLTQSLASVKVDLLQMPRFTLEYEASLNEALKALGMEVAFDPLQADFSGINPRQDDLHISQVRHKTFVEVNEEGTEAAAVTAVEIGITSAGPPTVTMRIDRPFVFAIREQATGAILFIGKVTHL